MSSHLLARTSFLFFAAASVGISLCHAQQPDQSQSVPFVVRSDDSSETATNFSGLLHKPAGKHGFVEVRDGHFFAGEQQMRFWGMNLCFGANFPTHEEADKIAGHFAKIGCNAIRFHHMDNQDAPGGIWKTNSNGQRSLDPEQVDRLDYFLARLHEHGVYANLNMHVSRELTPAEGFAKLDGSKWWSASNKWVMYYDPAVQAKVKEYCRDMLTHENPYRKMRRADDPGIAMIELLNENSFSTKGTELLPVLPKQYVDSFGVVWNNWLKEKYSDHDSLVAAWKSSDTETKLLLKPANWSSELGDWTMTSPNNKAKLVFDVEGPTSESGDKLSALCIEPAEKSEQTHFQQLTKRNLTVEKGKFYTLSFWVRADKNREFNFEISTAPDGEWRPVGMFETLKATAEWKQHKRTFQPEETTANLGAYIAASVGNDITPIEFAGVQLLEGVRTKPLPADQTLAKQNIGVPDAESSLKAHEDLKTFMVDTERKWLTELYSYLRDDLGVKVPITASQENYHAPGLLAETMDYVDLHSYWHHPLFKAGHEWSPEHYTVGNQAIESAPMRVDWPARSLITRTGWRYHGMPFTLSEWNHAEPGDVNTGCIMMAAIVGATQDWDGVFFFDYETSDSVWFDDHFEGFFDFNGQPAKQAVFSVASNIFLRGDLERLEQTAAGTFDDRLDGTATFTHRLGVDPKAKKADQVAVADTSVLKTPGESIVWDSSDPEHAFIKLNTPNSRGVWGLVGEREFEVGGANFKVGKVARNYATLLATSLDNKRLEDSKHILVLASSGAENSGMKWNAERTSVGANWGHGPTLVNIVPVEIELPVGGANVKVFAMKGSGERSKEIAAEVSGGKLKFSGGVEAGTIWYEVVIGE